MKDYIEERAVAVAEYIIEKNATVRQAAKKFGISKSTVHKDCTDRLRQINPALAKEERLAIVLGTEGEGLTDATIAQCDYTVKIPMYHGVDSLNVAAASAVAFWQLRGK